MKTLEQFIQEDLNYGDTDLETIFNDAEVDEMSNICKDYAVYVSKQALKKASEVVYWKYNGSHECRQAILSESNIPSL